MKKIALFGSGFPSLSERAELDPFWVLDVKRLQNAFFFNSFPLSSAGACLLAPFWSLPFCFFLLFLACFLPSGLRACWLARFWLSVACVVLSGSLSAVCGSYLLGLRVSGCWLPALSCLARFLPSLVCTCWVGCLWLLPACFVLSGSFPWPSALPTCLAGGVSGCYLPALSSLARFLPSLVCTCLVGCFWLLPTCSALSGSFPAVCGSYLLGWAFLAVSFPPSLVCACLLARFWPSRAPSLFSFFLARLSPFQRRACLVAAGSTHF